MSRLKNIVLASILTRFPSIADIFTRRVAPLSFDQTPWTPVTKPLSEMRLAMVTTAGVHLKTDKPFDMSDSSGDPTFRVIPSDADVSGLMITHDYYDHKDADRDINIVFPIERARELVMEGEIGGLAARSYGFMGHIEEKHMDTLVSKEAPRALAMLREDGAEAALLTPG